MNANPASGPLRRPLVLAHRGACQVAPENTLAAFAAALKIGADGVELDVQYSSDGRLVVFHNLDLEKTSTGTGRVTAHTFDELRALDCGSWFGDDFAGQQIPTLDEALETLSAARMVNVELKTFDQSTAGMGGDVAEIVRKHGMASRVVMSSFNPFALRRARSATRDIETGLLVAPDLPAWTRWRIIERLSRAGGVHPEAGMVNAAYVDAARRRGLAVRPWTVDDPEQMRAFVRFGVDAIITNVPDLLLRVLDEMPEVDR